MAQDWDATEMEGFVTDVGVLSKKENAPQEYTVVSSLLKFCYSYPNGW